MKKRRGKKSVLEPVSDDVISMYATKTLTEIQQWLLTEKNIEICTSGLHKHIHRRIDFAPVNNDENGLIASGNSDCGVDSKVSLLSENVESDTVSSLPAKENSVRLKIKEPKTFVHKSNFDENDMQKFFKKED